MAASPLPDFLQDNQTSPVIRDQMLATIPDLDTSEGSFAWDVTAAAAIQFATFAGFTAEMLRRTFAQTTFGAYLDLRAAEHGVTRLPAVPAIGSVQFTGTPGTIIPQGTQVSTLGAPTVPAQVFTTDAAVTILGSGVVLQSVTALVPGAAGNIAASAIGFLVSGVAGITALTNPEPFTGGVDLESDDALRSRYLAYVQHPPAGGNAADYVAWARAVPGVGNAQVVPLWNGPGTVAVYILDSNLNPAPQSLIDTVQARIAPPLVATLDPAAYGLGGFGFTFEVPPIAGALATSDVKLVYNASGDGFVLRSTIQTLFVDARGNPQPGIWQLRLRVRVDRVDQTANLLDVGIYNVTAGHYAYTTFTGTTSAQHVYAGTGLPPSAAFESSDVVQNVAWNGVDVLELRIFRKIADTLTTVWIDRSVLVSLFSSQTGAGLAPIGAQVTVAAPLVRLIAVAATLTIAAGYDVTAIRAAASAAVTTYLNSIAFATDPTVRYYRVGLALLAVPGITDIAALTIGGPTPMGTSNIILTGAQVPQLTTATWT